jgi:hypothetical protein
VQQIRAWLLLQLRPARILTAFRAARGIGVVARARGERTEVWAGRSDRRSIVRREIEKWLFDRCRDEVASNPESWKGVPIKKSATSSNALVVILGNPLIIAGVYQGRGRPARIYSLQKGKCKVHSSTRRGCGSGSCRAGALGRHTLFRWSPLARLVIPIGA